MSKELTAEEIAKNKYPHSDESFLMSYQTHKLTTDKQQAFIEGYKYSNLKLQEQAKEIERLNGENEIRLKRCTKLSLKVDEIVTLLHPFSENNLTEEEIQAILSWYNDQLTNH